MSARSEGPARVNAVDATGPPPVEAPSPSQFVLPPESQEAGGLSSASWKYAGRAFRRLPVSLLGVLMLQAVLSGIIAGSNTASGDEALYLWAGRLEWNHWLHGTTQPTFVSTFSGAPQLYPPIGAIASGLGGLVAARFLSTLLMLGATALLYSSARRLFSSRAALISIAVWVTSEPALRMGAYATYDPLAIFCVCLSVWLIIKSAEGRKHGVMVAGAGLAAAVAAMAAYSYAIYIPVVLAASLLLTAGSRSLRQAIAISVCLLGEVVIVLAAMIVALGLRAGIYHTIVNRSSYPDTESIPLVLKSAWSIGGLTALIAFAGVVIAIASSAAQWQRLMHAVFFCSVLLVPAYQAFVANTGWALDKHMAPGIWLASMSAGYGFSLISLPQVRKYLAAVFTAAVVVYPAASGWLLAYDIQRSWPNIGSLVAAARPLVAHDSGPYYSPEVYSRVLDYYTQSPGAQQWHGLLAPQPSASGAALILFYEKVIRNVRPGMVVLYFPGPSAASSSRSDLFRLLDARPAQHSLVRLAADTTGDPTVYCMAVAIGMSHDYKIAATGPYNSEYGSYATAFGTFVVWVRAGAALPPGERA